MLRKDCNNNKVSSVNVPSNRFLNILSYMYKGENICIKPTGQDYLLFKTIPCIMQQTILPFLKL
jgi:hypothetical protein